ncbi:hypothetical protein HK102_000701 [Quaeritorhiza haematococci]|nr:hypothetical protein HK102_000701 [Quaeritorhiza haematococci]
MEVVQFPRRPGVGTIGKQTRVRANFFPVLTLPGQNIHHYNVHIVPEAYPRLNRRIFAAWEELNRNDLLSNLKPVYDGRKNMFSPRPIPLENDAATFVIEVKDEEDLYANLSNPAPRITEVSTPRGHSSFMSNWRTFEDAQASTSLPSFVNLTLKHATDSGDSDSTVDNRYGHSSSYLSIYIRVRGVESSVADTPATQTEIAAAAEPQSSSSESGDSGDSGPKAPQRRMRSFRISIKKVGEINMHRLYLFLEGQLTELPHDAIMALDVVLRQRPSMLYTTVGRCFYTPSDSVTISHGAVLWRGFHQSIRPSKQRMLLNLDVSATAFYEPGPVVDIVASMMGRQTPEDIRQPFNERDRQRIEKALKGIKVYTTHRGNSKRKWKIASVTATSAERTVFPVKDKEGQEENVANYFKVRYNNELKFPHFPCLIVGNPNKNLYLPMEVCYVVQGQRILRKLNERQTADMIRFTCQPPQVRSQNINNGLNLLLPPDNEYLSDFNIKIGDEMALVNARVLPTPTLSYHPSSRESRISPREGAWNLRDKQVAQGATLNAWSVVIFTPDRDTVPRATVDKFMREFVTVCRDTGMGVLTTQPSVRYASPQSNIEAALKAAYMDARNVANAKPQLIFCVLPNTGVQLYGEIKRVGDTVIGVATQCIQVKHVFSPKKQYCANVCLKINVKLGGMNSYLSNQQIPFVSEKPTIIFGADVTHPPPGEFSKPSIAALVGSMDAQCSKYTAAVRVQKGRQEIIRDLGSMVIELLRSFYQTTRTKPARILFYRDGVSEGQFAEVVREEVASIFRACQALEPNYRPTVTFVVVKKRHHARFFVTKKEDADRSGNVMPGTVVDTGITHPSEFDFYLASHAGLQGTSKPTHYHVLFDENGFTADGLQELTYRLCYIYCRATRAVSPLEHAITLLVVSEACLGAATKATPTKTVRAQRNIATTIGAKGIVTMENGWMGKEGRAGRVVMLEVDLEEVIHRWEDLG